MKYLIIKLLCLFFSAHTMICLADKSKDDSEKATTPKPVATEKVEIDKEWFYKKNAPDDALDDFPPNCISDLLSELPEGACGEGVGDFCTFHSQDLLHFWGKSANPKPHEPLWEPMAEEVTNCQCICAAYECINKHVDKWVKDGTITEQCATKYKDGCRTETKREIDTCMTYVQPMKDTLKQFGATGGPDFGILVQHCSTETCL